MSFGPPLSDSSGVCISKWEGYLSDAGSMLISPPRQKSRWLVIWCKWLTGEAVEIIADLKNDTDVERSSSSDLSEGFHASRFSHKIQGLGRGNLASSVKGGELYDWLRITVLWRSGV